MSDGTRPEVPSHIPCTCGGDFFDLGPISAFLVMGPGGIEGVRELHMKGGDFPSRHSRNASGRVRRVPATFSTERVRQQHGDHSSVPVADIEFYSVIG